MQQYIIAFTVFLTPLLFASYTPNFFTTPKHLLLILTVVALILHSIYLMIIKKSISLSTSAIRLSLGMFAVAILLNLGLNPISRLESSIGPGSIYLSLLILSYFASTDNSRTSKYLIISAFQMSTTLLAIHTLAQLTFLFSITSLPVYMQSRAFTLTGNVLTTFILLAIGTIISIFLSLKKPANKGFNIFASITNFIALISLGATLLPGGDLAITLLPFNAGWSIALDAIKTPKSFFFGTGLSNFPIFFNSVKPLFLNATEFWNVVPTSSTSEVLHIMTTMGMIGVLSFLSIAALQIKQLENDDLYHVCLKIITAFSFFSLLLMPATLPILLIFFVSIGSLTSTNPLHKPLNIYTKYILSILLFIFIGTILYFSKQVFLAETYLRKAQLALAQNDGKALYEYSLKAVELMPYMASYRLSYAQVNLSLATALSQKSDLTETERSNISQLVSQAVREGKTAISLNPSNSILWQNLGNIYQKLINVAQGADQFAIEAYSQAVSLDPANPALRVEYGGLLYQLGTTVKNQKQQIALLNSAQNEFQTAIQLKPDYPNAYYNLAKLLELTKDYDNSYNVMQKAISLLGPDNPNLGKATSELEAIKNKIPKPTPTPKPNTQNESEVNQTQNTNPETSISTPSPLPEPLEGGPIELPSNFE